MDVKKGNIYEILNGSVQYTIPVFQRKYSWETKKQCARLWDDIVKMEESEDKTHFIGSIVLVTVGGGPIGYQINQIIDGQQRLTTLSLLLIAFRDIIKATDGESAKAINKLIINDSKDCKCKLVLTEEDDAIYKSLIDGLPINDNDRKSHIFKNYIFFKERISESELSTNQIWESMQRLRIVDIILNPNVDDEPQMIFECLNSTGLDLSQTDLIRNYILMGISKDEQSQYYSTYWKPMENAFPNGYRSWYMDRYFRDYLTMKTNAIPKIDNIYDSFKKFCNNDTSSDGCKTTLKDIWNFGLKYSELIDETSTDIDIRNLFEEIRVVKMEVTYPFLLKVYDSYTKGIIDKRTFSEIAKLTISYIVRRAVCEIPTNSLNHTFAAMVREIDENNYFESIKKSFLLLDSYKEFPTDNEFRESLRNKALYKMHLANYILVNLENFENRDNQIKFNTMTIEHILPQHPQKVKEWLDALGSNWADIIERYVHTIGNLTLTNYNGEMSNFPYPVKVKEYKKAACRNLNCDLIDLTTWNEQEIIKRAERLIELAVKIWGYPEVSQETLDEIDEIKNTESDSEYSFSSYDCPNVEPLFSKLNNAIMNLNDNIKCEYKKVYVAYKYSTNFVDIEPKANSLWIYINMKYEDIDDPHYLCYDISEIGHHGNGGARIDLSDEVGIEDVIKIVKQSLNKQLQEDGSLFTEIDGER